MKKILVSLFAAGLILFVPKSVFATDTCTTVYGQGVVCGAKTPTEFKQPVEAGFETNIRVLGMGLLGASGIMFYLSKKLRPVASIYINL